MCVIVLITLEFGDNSYAPRGEQNIYSAARNVPSLCMNCTTKRGSIQKVVVVRLKLFFKW